jgi:hypothetical protein
MIISNCTRSNIINKQKQLDVLVSDLYNKTIVHQISVGDKMILENSGFQHIYINVKIIIALTSNQSRTKRTRNK